MIIYCKSCKNLTKHKHKYRGHHCSDCGKIVEDSTVKIFIPKKYSHIKVEEEDGTIFAV